MSSTYPDWMPDLAPRPTLAAAHQARQDPLAALAAQHQARLLAAQVHQHATQHITLRWRPGYATPEERLAIAALLLAGTGYAIAPIASPALRETADV